MRKCEKIIYTAAVSLFVGGRFEINIVKNLSCFAGTDRSGVDLVEISHYLRNAESSTFGK